MNHLYLLMYCIQKPKSYSKGLPLAFKQALSRFGQSSIAAQISFIGKLAASRTTAVLRNSLLGYRLWQTISSKTIQNLKSRGFKSGLPQGHSLEKINAVKLFRNQACGFMPFDLVQSPVGRSMAFVSQPPKQFLDKL